MSILAGILLTAGIFSLDWFIKGKARAWKEKKPILGGAVTLQFMTNKGLAGSRLENHAGVIRWARMIVAVVFTCLVAAFFLSGKGSVAKGISLCMMTGGAINNAVDHWVHGAVTDYFSIGKGKYVFNLSDWFIFIGFTWQLILIVVEEFQQAAS